jgi:uncharacterized membrane protein YedE/YeeE
MNAILPLAKVMEWGPSAEVLAAVVLGFGFGFFLEKGGFGNSRVLAGQWYGYNFAVLRVMFTAVVTAMLGLFGLYYAGFVNLDLVHINETFLWPQVVGGVIFGFGFVIGQFCPGTAFVGAVTGKIDAMLYVAGFLGGAVLFGFAFPLFARFYESSNMGRVLLSDWLHVPAGIVVFAVVLMALGAFALTHFIDKKMGNA